MSEERWIKVEFWGLPPEGKSVKVPDPMKLAVAVAEVLGFEYLDGPVVTMTGPPASP